MTNDKEVHEDMDHATKRTALKRAAAGAAVVGTFGMGLAAFGGATAMAKPGNPGPHPNPPGPGVTAPANPGNGNGNGGAWVPGDPPGHNPFGPPGQVKKMPTLDLPGTGEVTNPFFNVPPGHWGDPLYAGLPATWLPEGFDLTDPLPLVLNPETLTWGVYVGDQFVPYVPPVAAPTG